MNHYGKCDRRQSSSLGRSRRRPTGQHPAAKFLGRLRSPNRRNNRPPPSPLGPDREGPHPSHPKHNRFKHHHGCLTRSSPRRNRPSRNPNHQHPHIPIAQASGRLRVVRVPVTPEGSTPPPPILAEGEKLITQIRQGPNM